MLHLHDVSYIFECPPLVNVQLCDSPTVLAPRFCHHLCCLFQRYSFEEWIDFVCVLEAGSRICSCVKDISCVYPGTIKAAATITVSTSIEVEQRTLELSSFALWGFGNSLYLFCIWELILVILVVVFWLK